MKDRKPTPTRDSDPAVHASTTLGQDCPPHSHAATSITVIVVTFNSADLLPDLIRSLPTGLGGCHLSEMIVADNASVDGTLSVVEDLSPDATVIRMDHNAGYAAAINAALAAARASDATLILNPDVRLGDESVGRMVRSLWCADVGVVVPRIIDPSGETAHSLRRRPTIGRALGEALIGGRSAGRLSPLGEVIRHPERYAMPGPVDWATGAAWLLSRGCLDAVGEWDETFFLYSEETDYALRTAEAGFRIWYTPDAVVTHIGGDASISPVLWGMLAVNRVRCYRKHHGAVATAVYFLAIALGAAVRAALGRETDREALRALVTWARDRQPPRIRSDGIS